MQAIWNRAEIGGPVFEGLTLGGVFEGTPLVKADYPGLRGVRLGDGTVILADDLPASYPVAGAGVDVLPAGALMPYAGASAPSGWLLCDGSSLLRADYPALFAAIGTAFGAADATHFALPDMRTRFPVGVGTGYALAATGGLASVTLTPSQMPQHNHTPGSLGIGNNNQAHQHPMGHTHDIGGSFISDVPATGTGARLRSVGAITTTTSSIANTGNQSGPHDHNLSGSTANAGGDGSHENRPPYLALNFIIRTASAGGSSAGVELWY